MDPRLKTLYDKRAMFIQQQKELLDKVIGEERGLTDEERAEQERLAGEVRKMDEIIAIAKTTLDEPRGDLRDDGEPQPTVQEFREFGDFLQAVRFNPSDPALHRREAPRGAEGRVMSMGVGAAGGFLVPDQFQTIIRLIDPQAAAIRPRAQVIPAGDPPDAAITIPSLDQSGAKGVYSGVVVTWLAEGHAKPETEPALKQIKLEPQEVAAHVVLTDKLLRNSAAAGALVTSLLRKAIIAAEDQAFLAGTGIGQPLGIIGHPACINIARTGALGIVYADIVAMYAAALFGGRLAWIASQSTLPQLMTMVAGVGGPLVWQPNAREGAPGTMLGIPVVLNHRSPVLGAQGDLMLVDLDYYLIKDGSGIAVAASEHPLFVHNRTIIKAWWNVDGQPWLTTPLLLEDGVSTVSPFVVLL